MSRWSWNSRDVQTEPFSKSEEKAGAFIRDEWEVASFTSIPVFEQLLLETGLKQVETGDWTVATVPTWRHSLSEPFRKPGVLFRAMLRDFDFVWRDVFTLLRYDHAFRSRLLQYGLFRGQK